MKMFVFSLCFFSLFSAPTCFAEAAATPSPYTTPVLICNNPKANLVIGICGIIGCDATVERYGATAHYNVKRKRYANGALDYIPGPYATKKCTFKVSALRYGMRNITNRPGCAPELKGARCHWLYP